jgi:hypothetical protein
LTWTESSQNAKKIRTKNLSSGRYVETYARRDGQWIWTKLHAQLDVLEAMPTGWQTAKWATT